jgi:hypothetical protein
MAPQIQTIRLQNVVYNVEIITGEMEVVKELFLQKREQISILTDQLLRDNRELIDLQQQLITLYIQTTGQFPSS